MRARAAEPRQWVERVAVTPDAWREACAAELAAGGRFCGAHASGAGRWSALFARGAGTRALVTEPRGGELDSIVELAPGAQWDEREAHDEVGLRFAGHEPLRPLLAHTEDTAAWTVPVEGRGVHQVAVGPVHAGVIESGHFRFHVVGERILHLDPKLFYKRRGLERAAAGRELGSGLAYAARACGACAVANSVAYAQACEGALGLVADRDLRRARTLLLELERLYNHLHDIAAICAGVGFAPGNMVFAALKERALAINDGLVGHRFLFGAVRLEESRVAVGAGPAAELRSRLRELREDFAAAWRELDFAASVRARLDGVGVLDRAQAARLGAVGPAARAAGLGLDARRESPGLWYGSGFAAAAPRVPGGDVAARLELRAVELEASFELLEELLGEPIVPGAASPGAASSGLGLARVESPRGETVCAIERQGSTLGRLRLRTSSYANWPALAAACAGNLLPDFPLINKSFELCYACVDR